MKIDLPDDVRLTMQSVLDGTAESPVEALAFLADELTAHAQSLGGDGSYTPREALVAHLQGYRQRIENALVSNRQRKEGDRIVGSAWLRIDGDELALLDDLILGRPPTYWLHYAWGNMTDEAKSGAVADAVKLLLTAGFVPGTFYSLTPPERYRDAVVGQVRVHNRAGESTTERLIREAILGRESQTDGQDQPEADDDAEAEPGPWTDGIAADFRADPLRVDSVQRPTFAELQAGLSSGYRFDDESWSAVRDSWNPNPLYLDPAIFAAFHAQRLASAEELTRDLSQFPLVVEDTPAPPEVPPPPPAVDGGDA